MSYQFNPMSDEEFDAINLLPDGDYDFKVIRSARKTSKAGNPMAELQLNIWDVQGKSHIIFDYLVFSHIALNIKKVSHFCKTTGLVEEYKKGEIPEDLSNLCGKLTLGTQDKQPKPGGGYYPKKNIVTDYVPNDGSTTKIHVKDSNEGLDDDIPF